MFTTYSKRVSNGSLRDRILSLACEVMATGLGPDRCSFYIQSDVIQQSQIYAIIQSLVPYEQLLSIDSFDLMRSSLDELPSLGLLGYPILESADVIAMQANRVPVGEHNLDHVEFCRSIVRRLNIDWGGGDFVIPVPISGGTNLPGLDGTAKMSKSLGNTISIRASTDEVRDAVDRMTLWQGDRCIAGEYLAAFDPTTPVDRLIEALRIGEISANEMRQRVFEIIEPVTSLIRRRYLELNEDLPSIVDCLRIGASKAMEIQGDTLGRLRQLVQLSGLD